MNNIPPNYFFIKIGRTYYPTHDIRIHVHEAGKDIEIQHLVTGETIAYFGSEQSKTIIARLNEVSLNLLDEETK